MFTRILLAGFFLFSSSIVLTAEPRGATKMYYIPFRIETYNAVTVKSITNHSPGILTKSDEILLKDEFDKATRVANFKFSSGRVRLLVSIEDATYICDAEGNCISNKFDMFVVSTAKLETILEKYVTD